MSQPQASSDAPILLTVPWVEPEPLEPQRWSEFGATLESLRVAPEVIDRSFFDALREHHGTLNATSLNAWLKQSVGDIGPLPRPNINFEREVHGRTSSAQLTRALATLEMHTPLDEAEAELRQDTLDTLRWLAELTTRANAKAEDTPATNATERTFRAALAANGGVFDTTSLNTWVKASVGDVGTVPRNSLNFSRDLDGKTTSAALRQALETLEAFAEQSPAEAALKQRALETLRWMTQMAARGGL